MRTPPAPAPGAGHSAVSSAPPARYAQHIEALRTRLAAAGLGGMSIRVEEPFVVIGNRGEERLAHDAQTVRWAADLLEGDFFDRRPDVILDVFLFGDAASYERGVKILTGEEPGTPYGFYSRTHRGLFMNIATGGGTLVHEIVHPYVEADFPAAPPWLNEGLGSLFEQSAQRSEHIVGLTNWRLDGLQRAIERADVPPFEALTRLTPTEFYGDDSGVNYAASRYLLYFVQEQGKLRDFYRAFRASAARDPSGFRTLAATLGARDMVAFQRHWQDYVAQLTFP
jgi:hypothetical protein